jgi:hypothetical protein
LENGQVDLLLKSAVNTSIDNIAKGRSMIHQKLEEAKKDLDSMTERSEHTDKLLLNIKAQEAELKAGLQKVGMKQSEIEAMVNSKKPNISKPSNTFQSKPPNTSQAKPSNTSQSKPSNTSQSKPKHKQ